jgi:hypothetical protein
MNTRIDPILIATVCLIADFENKRWDKLEQQFLAKLMNGKPVEYYGRHIKSLAIYGGSSQNEDINRILAICTGVENLLLVTPAWGLDLFLNPQAGRNFRRLTIHLERFFPRYYRTPNFDHPCFANLTHLHLLDDEDWTTYAGWESLTSLTHLAFSCCSPEQLTQLMQTLSTIQYVALGSYRSGERYKYTTVMVNNSPHIRAAWSVRAVLLSEIPIYDWKEGARGEGDFWDVVEREVERRLEESSVD